MNTSSNILITGAPRSGTTYVGKVLEQNNSYIYFHEPFRDNHGIWGIRHRFPFAQSFNYAEIVDKFFYGNAKFIVKWHQQNTIWKYYIKKLIGNTDQIKYRKYFKKKTSSKNLLLKDPIASFLSDYIFSKGYAKVIVMVRHPMALYYSLKQKGSDFDFINFLEQEELVETYLKEEIALMKNAHNLSYEERIALFWKCIYKVLITFGNKHQDKTGWLIVKHEDISNSPINFFQALCDRLKIQFTEEMKIYITETSYHKGKVLAQNNALHDFKRDSSALKDYWKHMVTEEQTKIIYNITSDISDLFYDKSSWQ